MKRRHSKKREQILEVLRSTSGTLSAADIHAALPTIDLTTIYRNLELFVSDSLIKKFNIGPSNEAVYEYQDHPHHHAICTDCDKVIHFTAPDEKIKKLLGLTNFEVQDIEVTVHGTCKHKK